MKRVEIVGGGLAGLSLGIALRNAGVSVTLFEAGNYPRHRVCGEFINGLAPSTIRALGIEDAFRDAVLNRDVAWVRAGRALRHQRLRSPALGLSRYELDQRLAELFVARGGELQTDHRVGDTEGEISGRVLALGRRRARTTWIGLKLHALDFPLLRDLEVHLGERAYVGATRVENGRVNLCGFFQRRSLGGRGGQIFLGYLRAAGLDDLADRLREAEIDEASFCAVAALQCDRSAIATPELRLGDACAMIPPFTGNGMAMAFQSAECALGPLVAFARGNVSWSVARQTVQRALRRRFRVRLAVAQILHPFLLQRGMQATLSLLNRAQLVPLTPLHRVLH